MIPDPSPIWNDIQKRIWWAINGGNTMAGKYCKKYDQNVDLNFQECGDCDFCEREAVKNA